MTAARLCADDRLRDPRRKRSGGNRPMGSPRWDEALFG